MKKTALLCLAFMALGCAAAFAQSAVGLRMAAGRAVFYNTTEVSSRFDKFSFFPKMTADLGAYYTYTLPSSVRFEANISAWGRIGRHNTSSYTRSSFDIDASGGYSLALLAGIPLDSCLRLYSGAELKVAPATNNKEWAFQAKIGYTKKRAEYFVGLNWGLSPFKETDDAGYNGEPKKVFESYSRQVFFGANIPLFRK